MGATAGGQNAGREEPGSVTLTAAQWATIRQGLAMADVCADFEEMEADDAPDEETETGLRNRVADIRAAVAAMREVG
jgi:hypothetical protein